jgi:hypothetical protein
LGIKRWRARKWGIVKLSKELRRDERGRKKKKDGEENKKRKMKRNREK